MDFVNDIKKLNNAYDKRGYSIKIVKTQQSNPSKANKPKINYINDPNS